ncbi:heat shock 70 kDa protein-like isoform X2 [Sycon ciliatum]|uniref:heat shock 70 kDa protein-like isoform X2 n=1 Tax=Sycon ciliatum TaxID=27933 RepID=UPI0031F69210|eukprot:scpid59996/ scgid5712/ Heat shock 70 kDa protein cognate 4
MVPSSESPKSVCAVGIDLGTTYSCVAAWRNGRAEVLENSMGARTTPSWVAYKGKDVLVGEAAVSQAARNAPNTIFDAKRMIGRQYVDQSVHEFSKLWPFSVVDRSGNCCMRVEADGQEKVVCPEEVSARVLMKMKHAAEDRLGCQVESAVVTVPAYFNDAQRQATVDACSIAGLRVERIINEPTAASLAYGLDRVQDDTHRNLLVYDLGGGTLDVTVLEVEGTVFEIRSTSGDMQLGGQDFDSNLVNHVIPQVVTKCGCSEEEFRANSKAVRKLREACQKLKHTLSHSLEGTIEVDALYGGEDFDSSLTRGEFDAINQQLLDRSLLPVERALDDAGMSKDEVDEVVLIGGSTRIVAVQNLLEAYFPGKSLSKRINPDEAVAMGAAIQAANLTLSYDQKKGSVRDGRLEGLTLMDVLPHSLGIELANGNMSVVIKRNTTIPYKHTRTYYNNEDDQTEVDVEVFEGEEKRAANNRLLGKFTLPGIPPRPRGKVRIDVTFSVDENSILEVSAEAAGEDAAPATLVIEKEKGLLGQTELDEKISEARRWEETCRTKRLN